MSNVQVGDAMNGGGHDGVESGGEEREAQGTASGCRKRTMIRRDELVGLKLEFGSCLGGELVK